MSNSLKPVRPTVGQARTYRAVQYADLKTGSPADAGLPGFHGWAYWGAGSHPRQSGLFDLDSLSNEDRVWVLDRLFVLLAQAFPATIHVVTPGDLAERLAPLHANGLTARTSTVLLWSGLVGDLLRRVARLLGCDAPGLVTGVALLDALPGGAGWNAFSRRTRSRYRQRTGGHRSNRCRC
jgi:hypothetical protein